MKSRIVTFLAVTLLTVACKPSISENPQVQAIPKPTVQTWEANINYWEQVCAIALPSEERAMDLSSSGVQNFCRCVYESVRIDTPNYEEFIADPRGAIAQADYIIEECDAGSYEDPNDLASILH